MHLRFPVAILALVALLSAASASGPAKKESPSFKVDGGHMYYHGKEVQILSGEMHPSRIPHQYWRSRIQMAKAMGLNAIAVYIFWNVHEPEPGRFNFKGDADIAEFVKICQEEGMMVLLRPGPYCCAEWEFGGLPYWLLNISGMKLRAYNAPFLTATDGYFKKLGQELHPYFSDNGGNIVMVQVENEYGSYGKDKQYMTAIKDLLVADGFDAPFNLADGSDQLANDYIPGTIPGVNGAGSPSMKETVDKYRPGGPYYCPEFYPGWLDHWGEPFVKSGGDVASYFSLIKAGISVSLYMFQGGTNFGFMNGSNWDGALQPSITSYDYDAPLDESGRPTAKYFAFRKAIIDATGVTPPVVPVLPEPVGFAATTLHRDADLYSTLTPSSAQYRYPPTFEEFGQAYGFVDYRLQLNGPVHGSLVLADLRDYAVVMVDGKPIGTVDDRTKGNSVMVDSTGTAKLDILVENLGRINYGGRLPDNYHGLLGPVTLGGKELTGWRVTCLPMSKAPNPKSHSSATSAGPAFYSGTFQISKVGDTFVDMRSWGKGVVWVNGHNLGRYWNIGPQQTLYLPGCWLKKGANQIEVFEELSPSSPTVAGLPKPILDDLAKK